MAKRRKLEAPTSADLDRIEEEFRRETSDVFLRPTAPIAQVAAETAGALEVRSAELRAREAKDRADARAFHDAAQDGRVILEIPLSEIDADSMIRDRTAVDEEELTELQNSIAAHGMRLPIEVYETGLVEGQGARYGLLSGYRRYLAVQRLRDVFREDRFTTIKALVRNPQALGGSFVAMVEENEVRSSLSPYERGRVAVIAAQNGAFASVEAAVDALFASASKAKRSKIRSFASVFEELGDLLAEPELLSEKQGLRLANALRSDREGKLRSALETARPSGFEEELAVLEEALSSVDLPAASPRKGGRPRKEKAAPLVGQASGAWSVKSEKDSRGHLVRIDGPEISPDVLNNIIESVRACLK